MAIFIAVGLLNNWIYGNFNSGMFHATYGRFDKNKFIANTFYD
jgi:hypothetical protein